MRPLADDWKLFALCGAAVAFLVWGLLLFAALRWRRRTNDEALPPQFRNNVRLEIMWTLAPLALVCVLFVYAYRAEADVDALAVHPDVTVDVQGYRWGWTFAYRNGPQISGAATSPIGGGGREAPPELVLPQHEITEIDLTSRDVNHSLWIPALLYKRDAIPGQLNRFDLRPGDVGTFVGRCAAFCGLNHAAMTFSVRVVPAPEFARWLAQATAR